MKVEWFRSATVGIYSDDGTRILCDPWITNGAFIGSWFHFPRLEGFEFKELVDRKWDALYISHLHADHFDRKLVAAIARKQPDCIVILPKFTHKWLYRAVANCGFEPNRILEIETNRSFKIKDFKIKIFTADYCNPEVCGVGTPCLPVSPRERAIDSLALFEADGQTILNANDALAVQSASKLWPIIGPVDMLLGHYGGAGPYPQAFVDLSDTDKYIEAKKLSEVFLSRLIDASIRLKARFVMPYAGQYVLAGTLSDLNPFRSVVKLEEALHSISKDSNSTPVSLKPFSEFNLTTGEASATWREPSEVEVTDYIGSIKAELFPYQLKVQNWSNVDESIELALTAVGNEYLARKSLSVKDYRISVVVEESSKTIQFNSSEFKILDGNFIDIPDTTSLDFDSRLLKRIITRVEGYRGFTPYHFNQAEIGSHIKWSRNGDYNPVVSLLNFMQVEV